MAQLFVDHDYDIYGIRARNVFGHMDPVCDEDGEPVNLRHELEVCGSDTAAKQLIAGVLRSVERQEKAI